MINTKIIICLLTISSFFACQELTKDKPTNTTQNEIKDSTRHKKESAIIDSSELNLITEINREEARKLDASTSMIGAKIRELLVNSKQKLSIEELLDQRLVFRNNRGKIIEIPLRSVVDTFYYE